MTQSLSAAAVAGRALTVVIIIGVVVVGVALAIDDMIERWQERRAIRRLGEMPDAERDALVCDAMVREAVIFARLKARIRAEEAARKAAPIVVSEIPAIAKDAPEQEMFL